MSTDPLLKAVQNTQGAISSAKADALLSTYQEFKKSHMRLADSITANYVAETNGSSRNSTTQGIISNALTLSLLSERLSKAIADYLSYMEKENLGTAEQRAELKSYRNKFKVYGIKLGTLGERAKVFQKTRGANTYKHHKRNRGARYNNYRANAVALKWKSTNEGREDISIVLNQFTDLLRQVLPQHYVAKITPNENVGVGNLFGNSEGGKRLLTKVYRTHTRKTRRI
jgi:hypothetical protein